MSMGRMHVCMSDFMINFVNDAMNASASAHVTVLQMLLQILRMRTCMDMEVSV